MIALGIRALAGMALAIATAQAADTPSAVIRLEDLFLRPVGPRGLEPTPLLRAAVGQQVRLAGWMVARDEPSPGYFLLAPRPVQMSEHADGEADDLPPGTVLVRLPDPQHRMPHQGGPLELQGQLEFGQAIEADGRVSWVRLLLPPPSARISP